MSTTALPHPGAASGRPFAALGVTLLLWFALVTWCSARGVLLGAPGDVPFALITAVTAPVAAYFIGWRWSAGFRALVLAADLRLLVAMQAWRFLGFGFVALHIHGVLPGVFAWPAGLGDMAVAAAAPWMLMRLLREPGFERSAAFARWNWLGVLDLVVAVSAGALGSGLVPSLTASGVTTAPLAQLPLSWVPTFGVPLMIMFHATALLQGRQRAD
jgi:hypothetical protein